MTGPIVHPTSENPSADVAEARLMSRRTLGGLFAGGVALAADGALAQPAPVRRDPIAASRGLMAGDWFQQVRAQHRAVDRQFALIEGARGANQRRAYLRDLATLLTAHSIAEEVALYPGLAMAGFRPAADEAYRDQSEAKIAIAELDAMPDPLAPRFERRLADLKAAIADHVRQEENSWYPELQRRAGIMNDKMTRDFRQSFRRYMDV